MSDITQPSLFHKLRHTPMSDLFRLRLTGRLDWKAIIERSDLPQPATSLLHRVVRKTRLWHSEKVNVAEELVSHFSDGIESGESCEALIRNFGDEHTSAKLIRRAKKRNRPLAWHAFNLVRWMFAGLIAFYVGVAVYFYMGRPTVKVDYIAELNHRIEQTAPNDRAWPIYREVLLALPWRGEHGNTLAKALYRGPRDEHWGEAMQWLNNHQFIISRVREGAAKPSLGFRIGEYGDADDRTVFPEQFESPLDNSPFFGRSLKYVIEPYLTKTYELAVLLCADAAAARQKQDAQRFADDITALMSLAEQAYQDRTLINAFRQIGIRKQALHQLEESLIESPRLLSEGQLRAIAHCITKPRVAADLMTFETERMYFYDIVQRVYSDDAHGDGRLTPAGLAALPAIRQTTSLMILPTTEIVPDYASTALGPAAMMTGASRRELLSEYDRLMDVCEANLHRPAWEVDFISYQTQTRDETSSKHWKRKFALLTVTFPSLTNAQSGMQWDAERSIAHQDALAAAIALELFHRQEGKYPQKLEELVPAMLPALPLDRFTGQPLHYALRDGQPIIYSVGVDRDDDGGKIAYRRDGEIDNRVSCWRAKAEAPDGDWLLFPEPQDTREEDK